MIAIAVLLAVFGLTYALWLFFLAVMSLKHARDTGTITPWATRFGLPILWVGYVLDFLVNVFVLTVFLFDLPQEWLVTARMKRYLSAGGWRSNVARWFCDNLLKPFDQNHCA